MSSDRVPVVGFDFADPELEARIRSGLVAVEKRLSEAVSSEDPFVEETARHLVDAGGKRFRPLVVLLAAALGDLDAPDVVPAAVVVELTHLATLYHDDVMDEAVVRRGAQSANARWTNTIAILTGDFLFARASDILADLGPAAVRIQARTFERLVKGQIHETTGPREDEDAVSHHLDVIAEKTGSLIATAGLFGAQFGGSDPDTVATMTAFGELIGVAFQLSDDLIDIVADTAESGKTPGTDLREGVPTLPVLLVRTSHDPADDRLRELVAGPIIDPSLHAEALQLLRDSTATRQAHSLLEDFAARARELLGELSPSSARDALEALTYFVVARTG